MVDDVWVSWWLVSLLSSMVEDSFDPEQISEGMFMAIKPTMIAAAPM